GMWECLKSGWLRQQLERNRLKVQEEVNERKRLIVGVNAFQGEEGPINRAIERTSYRVPSRKARLQNIAAVRKLRRERGQQGARTALREVYEAARESRNIVRPVIEAAKASVTIGEVVGVMRLAYGYGYDPLRQIATPAFIAELTGD
ncbi:MAG: methylmalonyl-CoA mutase, partial [Dehalococcoidia bacterium]|nr:methylmalonyl-CoA mutase [Dehalococcoidia bacterium]